MSDINRDEPAFPVSLADSNGHQSSPFTWQYPGISIRDYFAGFALQGLLAGKLADGAAIGEPAIPVFTERSYQIADAMLAERAK